LIKDCTVVRPEVAGLVVSMHEEMLYAERVLRAGGRGYIMKQERPESILRAIRQVLEGPDLHQCEDVPPDLGNVLPTDEPVRPVSHHAS
jgi:DNA-binding NarL/FixJ family response regulator